MKFSTLTKLTTGTGALAIALASAPAFAQDQGGDDAAADGSEGSVIVVTGSILRRTDTETASPVTFVSAEELDQRGFSTVQDGIQQLASNNGPALTNSFTANGAFAGGAAAISLRGLTTSSSLVLFDGMRAAYYPLSDDGTRNFVNLNMIPDDIVERVEVLRDGASSVYGADAIAGVVNIITKREFQGFSARAEAGISDRNDAGSQRLSMTAGFGDLERDGVNVYASGFYYKSNELRNSQRPYPYNTTDYRGLCQGDVCGPNNTVNPLDANGMLDSFSTGTNTQSPFIVRPYDAANTTAQDRFQLLNGCRGLDSYTLTAQELLDNAIAPETVCLEDRVNLYGSIQPKNERFGVSTKATAKVNDDIEAYFEINFMQSTSSYHGFPSAVRANGPTGINFPRFSTRSPAGGANSVGSFELTLPIYVCSTGVGAANGIDTGCNAMNGTLNPNNPFAADGQVARIWGNLPYTQFNAVRDRSYRGALGVQGEFGDIAFDAGFTAMHTDLRRTREGYIYIQHLLDLVATGELNFVDFSQNSQDTLDYLTPTSIVDSSSDLYEGHVSFSTDLVELPGGPLQVAVGAAIRYEAIDAPSGNPDDNGPTQRYFVLNAFGTKGDRTVKALYAEAEAPITDFVTVNLSGRYDDYSSGQNNFSPKAGVKFKPIDQLVLRGTYSRGFRIPSFGEANALPTTGFVTAASSIYNDTYLAQYGCTVATFNSCPTYIRGASYGLTTLASPNLDPEKSRSITLGAVFEPTRNFTFTVDYYDIKKTGAITTASSSPAILAYYSGQPIPDGFTVIPDSPDPSNPTATPRLGFVGAQLINSDTVRSKGIDFGAYASFDLGSVHWTSVANASYIIELSTTFPDGTKERYEGTLGNFNLTAGTGTPQWKGSWLNTFEMGKFEVNATVNYFDGYNLSAADQGDTPGDCGQLGSEQYVKCDVSDYITFDLNAQFEINDNFTFYATMNNVFDRLPPIDPVTYGATSYNAVQGGNGILGRYLKAGVKVNF